MSDFSYEKLVQREKWRQAKAAWREKNKNREIDIRRKEDERRHQLSKLTLDEENLIFRDYLRGDSHSVLSKRYSLSESTVNKILGYWTDLCKERLSLTDIENKEPEEKEDSGGFFKYYFSSPR